MIPWSKHNPDSAPAALIQSLPSMLVATWSAGERKTYTKAPEGYKPIIVRVGDKFHAYAIPEDAHFLTLKCALRWEFKGKSCHGTKGHYTVEL